MRSVTWLAVVATALLAGCNNTVTPPAAEHFVEVSGEGRVEAVADRFRIHASASAHGDDISKLKADVDRQIDAAVAALKQLGLDDRAIQALTLSVNPQWEWQPQRRLIGYQAQRQLNIAIDGLDTYSEALQRLAEVGLTDIQPGGSYLSNEQALADEALALAVADARRKADILANSAGRSVGRALVITESGGNVAPMPMMMEAARSKQDSYYSAGTSTVERRVSVRFALD